MLQTRGDFKAFRPMLQGGECLQDILADRDRFFLLARTDPRSLAESLHSGITLILIHRTDMLRGGEQALSRRIFVRN